MAALPSPSNESDEHKVIKGFNGWRFYFVSKGPFEHFRDYVMTHCRKQVIEIISPESDEQIHVLKSDEKVVYRERLFYNQYQWKIELDGLSTVEALEDLRDWAASIFADQNDASRVKLSKSYMGAILYCKHEDDVVMTKLTYAHSVKNITHAIAAPSPTNNNNKGTTHASSTLPPSS